MWNLLNLKCPTDVCKYGVEDEQLLKELPDLVSLLTSSAEVLTQDHPIWTEIKIFQNIQAKYKRILHCDKCLLLLQKVGNFLRKMVLLNLSRTYLDLAEHFLEGLQTQNAAIFLPSRQQFAYVLVRTQSAAKLICEALHYSRETFCYLIQKLKVGHLILNLMMATSVTARVNILFRGILVQIFDLYRKLFAWCQKLKIGTSPQFTDIPEDLEDWLNIKESDLLKPKLIPKDQMKFLTNFFDKQKNDSEAVESETVPKNDNETMDDDCVILDEDTGEVVPRKEDDNNEYTESQSVLLSKIMNAKSFKKLSIIWDNLDVSSHELLPQVITPAKIRLIDKMFLEGKSKIKDLKKTNLTFKDKKIQVRLITKLTGRKLAKHLGLFITKPKELDNTLVSLKQSLEELKPVRTFKDLKQLYQILYQIFQTTQQYAKCNKLKKVFKSRKADIRLLIKKGDKAIARKLIFCTSKVFLTRYKP